MKFLITAFEPFGNDYENPTMDVIKGLEEIICVDTMVLPVTFDFHGEFLASIKDKKYDFIVHLGQAGGRNKISFEKIAINNMDAKNPDNAGNKPVGELVKSHGADGLFTTLPIRELVLILQQKGYPVNISYTAGTYVCNYTMYLSLHHFRNSKTKVGFVHIPYSPQQVIEKDQPSMSVELVTEVVKETIRILSKEELIVEKKSLGEIQ